MPAKSKSQFRFMKAIASGSIKKPGLSKEKAVEIKELINNFSKELTTNGSLKDKSLEEYAVRYRNNWFVYHIQKGDEHERDLLGFIRKGYSNFDLSFKIDDRNSTLKLLWDYRKTDTITYLLKYNPALFNEAINIESESSGKLYIEELQQIIRMVDNEEFSQKFFEYFINNLDKYDFAPEHGRSNSNIDLKPVYESMLDILQSYLIKSDNDQNASGKLDAFYNRFKDSEGFKDVIKFFIAPTMIELFRLETSSVKYLREGKSDEAINNLNKKEVFIKLCEILNNTAVIKDNPNGVNLGDLLIRVNNKAYPDQQIPSGSVNNPGGRSRPSSVAGKTLENDGQSSSLQ